MKGELDQKEFKIQNVMNVVGENQADIKDDSVAIKTLQTDYDTVRQDMFAIKQYQDSFSIGQVTIMELLKYFVLQVEVKKTGTESNSDTAQINGVECSKNNVNQGSITNK